MTSSRRRLLTEFSYACIECGQEYVIEPGRYVCDICSAKQSPDEPLRGQLEVRLKGEDGGPPSAPESWTRPDLLPYADPRLLMPVPIEFFPSIPVGNTPLWEPKRLRNELGLEGLYLKDDTANPTGSLKDRASYLVAAFAAQHGLKDIVVASTGNAGSSMSGIGAAAGLNIRLYLPASAPPAKICQALQYGAKVIKVDGNYDQAFELSLAYVTEHGGLSRNTGHNPLTVEGKKSAALEIFRQLGGVIPDLVYVPTGDGVIISGVYKGFEDLVSLGLAECVPEVICVQAEGSSAMTKALTNGAFGAPVSSKTLADSISVDVPRGGYFALDRLQRHKGRAVTVSDEAIIRAQKHLSSVSGLFAEPAAAAAYAGLLADRETGRGPGRTDKAVVLVTGNGLKDITTAMKGVEL